MLDGTVRALENGTATITFSDAYSEEGGEVEITYKGESLGTATAHIHMPYELTTSEKGYITACSSRKTTASGKATASAI